MDYQSPDYVEIFNKRLERLQRIRAEPASLKDLKLFYRDHPAKFISDWGCTSDPRNIELGRPVVIPFVLFERQVEWIDWVLDSWRCQRPGVSPKSRESGMSWMAIALSCTLCLFYDNLVIGFGSKLLELVDKLGDPKCLFWKAREFMATLPKEFSGSWNRLCAPEKLIKFPDTGSVIVGEGGDEIGRGGRTSIYFIDEAAHIERPELLEASLSQTTNCRIDISTPKGMGNPFHRKVIEWPAERVFRFHWRDDPRKDEDWYAKQCSELDPVVIAQELDIDFSASVEGVLIPSQWVQAAVDAHKKLAIEPTGASFGALDVADEGRDLNAFCGARGWLVEALESWSGKGDDIFGTVHRAFRLCDDFGYRILRYDADGLGAGVRGDARVINDQRSGIDPVRHLRIDAFRGSGPVYQPERQDVKGRLNKDFFANLKAQSWWGLRRRFQSTYRAVNGEKQDPAGLISLSSSLKLLGKLSLELSQPTYSINLTGKIVIDKLPDGARSPNLADAVMMRFAAIQSLMIITDEHINAIRPTRRRFV